MPTIRTYRHYPSFAANPAGTLVDTETVAAGGTTVTVSTAVAGWSAGSFDITITQQNTGEAESAKSNAVTLIVNPTATTTLTTTTTSTTTTSTTTTGVGSTTTGAGTTTTPPPGTTTTAAGQATFIDNFMDAVTPEWTTLPGAAGMFLTMGGGWADPANNGGNQYGGYWSANALNNDQFVEAGFYMEGDPGISELRLRQSSTIATYFQLAQYLDSEPGIEEDFTLIQRVVNGTSTQLGTIARYPYMRMEIQGSTLRIYGKATAGAAWGSPVATYTGQSQIASGWAGAAVSLWGGIKEFKCGNL